MVVAGVVKAFGTGWLNKLLPPALVGSIVIVIGLGLSAVAVKMALFPMADPTQRRRPAGGSRRIHHPRIGDRLLVVLQRLHEDHPGTHGYRRWATWQHSSWGWSTSRPSWRANWIGLPTLTFPKFELGAILIIAPIAFVVIVEHIGHLLVINEITGKDFTPLLPESLFGDGLATAISGAVGGTPSTTYAENIGVMAVTKVYATQLFWFAGALAFVIGGFVPKLGALISSIPTPVMGGISLLLFGLIASSGLRLLVKSGIDYSHSRNLIMSSVVLGHRHRHGDRRLHDPAGQLHDPGHGSGDPHRRDPEPGLAEGVRRACSGRARLRR